MVNNLTSRRKQSSCSSGFGGRRRNGLGIFWIIPAWAWRNPSDLILGLLAVDELMWKTLDVLSGSWTSQARTRPAFCFVLALIPITEHTDVTVAPSKPEANCHENMHLLDSRMDGWEIMELQYKSSVIYLASSTGSTYPNPMPWHQPLKHAELNRKRKACHQQGENYTSSIP